MTYYQILHNYNAAPELTHENPCHPFPVLLEEVVYESNRTKCKSRSTHIVGEFIFFFKYTVKIGD